MRRVDQSRFLGLTILICSLCSFLKLQPITNSLLRRLDSFITKINLFTVSFYFNCFKTIFIALFCLSLSLFSSIYLCLSLYLSLSLSLSLSLFLSFFLSLSLFLFFICFFLRFHCYNLLRISMLFLFSRDLSFFSPFFPVFFLLTVTVRFQKVVKNEIPTGKFFPALSKTMVVDIFFFMT